MLCRVVVEDGQARTCGKSLHLASRFGGDRTLALSRLLQISSNEPGSWLGMDT
jgi:hypothetical protein